MRPEKRRLHNLIQWQRRAAWTNSCSEIDAMRSLSHTRTCVVQREVESGNFECCGVNDVLVAR